MTKLTTEEQLAEIARDLPLLPPTKRKKVAKLIEMAWSALLPPAVPRRIFADRVLQMLHHAGSNIDGLVADGAPDDARLAKEVLDDVEKELRALYDLHRIVGGGGELKLPSAALLLRCIQEWRPSRLRGRGRPKKDEGGREREVSTVRLLAQIGLGHEENKPAAIRRAVERKLPGRRALPSDAELFRRIMGTVPAKTTKANKRRGV